MINHGRHHLASESISFRQLEPGHPNSLVMHMRPCTSPTVFMSASLPFLKLQAVDLDDSIKPWFCWGPRRISSTEFSLGSLQLLLQGLWSLLAPVIWSPRKHHIVLPALSAWLECVNAVCISGNILALEWAWTSCTVMGHAALMKWANPYITKVQLLA